MKLRYITCSDPRENISVPSILKFAAEYPMIEIGVQAHPGPMSYHDRRNTWFNQIVWTSQGMSTPPNIALHMNYEWCDCMCRGIIPLEAEKWLHARNEITGKPVIQRIQLNIGDSTYLFNAEKLSELINQHSDQEFILPWNQKVARQIQQLKETGAKFSLLFDASYGAGIEPDKWRKPVYNDIPNGYAGGLGPGNIARNLNKINKILPKEYETWIDAEGRLRDIYDTCSFSLNLAEKYVQEVISWQQKHTK